MNKETLISVISKMIDCGQISIQAVQALSSLGYVDAKRVLEICKNNNLVVESDDKELVPCVTTDELYALIDNNAIDLNLPEQERIPEFCDMVKLISEYVDLVQIEGKPKYFAKCPFHFEHQPSMIINAKEQCFHCFSCGLSGSSSDFEALVEEKGIKKKGD